MAAIQAARYTTKYTSDGLAVTRALLEVLAPEPHVSFVDHSVDQPFALSLVLFIATLILLWASVFVILLSRGVTL